MIKELSNGILNINGIDYYIWKENYQVLFRVVEKITEYRELIQVDIMYKDCIYTRHWEKKDFNVSILEEYLYQLNRGFV